MGNEYRFLVDEDLSPDVAGGLCGDGFDATHVQDSPGKGADDDEVLCHAIERDLIVVTNDSDFLRPERRGRTPILFVADSYQANPYETVDVLGRIADTVPRNELPAVVHVSDFG
jgi:predicted nuclease of predicted toxin-antitoxin system